MGDRGARLSRERDHRRRGRLVDVLRGVREGTAKLDDPQEHAYAELLLRCRRMAGLRACSDQDPSKLRFYLL